MKKSIIALLLFVATQLVCTVVAMGIVCIPHITELSASGEAATAFRTIMDDGMTIHATILGLILSEIAMFIILWKSNYFTPSDLIRPVPQHLFWLSIPFILLAMFALNMINSAFDLPNLMEEEFNQIAASVWGMLSIAVFGPIIEELVFRRVMIDDITQKTGKAWVAVLISSVLFGLIHMNPAQIVFAIPVGAVFGWIYVKTGSMLPGLVGHLINNSIAVLEIRLMNSETFIPEGTNIFQEPIWIAIFTACVLLVVSLAFQIHRSCLPAVQNESNADEKRYVR